MNWQRQTLLHHVCGQQDPAAAAIDEAAILIDAGANVSARDEDYRSTPLGWAVRTNAIDMVKFLLSRGAPTNLPDDELWATPLQWAERRQHQEIAEILRRHGAERQVRAASRRSTDADGSVGSTLAHVVRFSIFSPSTCRQCFSLLVTSVNPQASACAAINASKLPFGLPLTTSLLATLRTKQSTPNRTVVPDAEA